jgi:very-short-patch-repair endonuclease
MCYRRFKGESSLETKFKQALTELSLNYVQETQIGRYSVDFLLSESRVIIEVDGDYWHNGEKDSRKDAYLQNRGWKVVRFKESELEAVNNWGWFIRNRLQDIANMNITCPYPPLTSYV